MSLQARRAEVLAEIVADVTRRVKQLWDYAEAHPEAGLAEWEETARQLSRECFAPALAGLIEERCRPAEAAPRCECGREPRYKGESGRRLETYLGRVEWRRGYYYCGLCRQGQYPLDQALGIGPGLFSEGVQEGVCRLGASLPFVPAAETFGQISGLSLSGREVREVERLTEARGAAVEAVRQAEQEALLGGGPPGPLPASSTAPARPAGKGVWAVSLDAAKVRFADGWHDVKAGVVFWAPRQPEGRAGPAQAQSYAAEVGSMEQAGRRLYTEALRRGIDPAEELVVCLGDGAPANWSQFALHFPRRIEILDWFHAVEHLWAAGNGLFGTETAAAKAWVVARKAELWEGQVDAVLRALREAAAQPGGQAAAAEIHYFATNQDRMRYDQFRAAGYPIGSGTVESACKRLIGARAKQAGMCWTKAGLQAVLTLRAELLSGRWEAAWRFTRPKPSPRKVA